jgi:hypothetical protein
VPRGDLVTNGRGRETVGTVLQGGPPEVAGPLLGALALVLDRELDAARRANAGEFAWSPVTVHVLELLTAAYQGRAEWPYETVRPLVEELVDEAWREGSVSDRKFALDCLPLLSEETREQYIDRAFAGDSNWIRVTALRDCATLPALSPAIRASIRRLLITRLGRSMPAVEAQALDVDLERLRAADDFVGIRRILDRTPVWVVLLALPAVVQRLVGYGVHEPEAGLWQRPPMALLAFLFPVAVFWSFQATSPLSYGGAGTSTLLDSLRRWPSVWSRTTESFAWWLAMTALGGTGVQIVMTAVYIARGEPPTGMALSALLTLLPTLYAVLWGPSVLYAVHHGWSAHRLRGARRVLVVTVLLRLGWSGLREQIRRFGPRSLATTALWVGVMCAVYLLMLRSRIAILAAAAGLVLITVVILNRLLVSAIRDLRSRRRVDEALRVCGDDPSLFFTALFTLRDAAEAAAYVRRVRDVPRAGPLDVDRPTLRLCIAVLQDRTPHATGVSAEGLRRLERWKGGTALLDELGRLDEQLRAR